MHHNNNFINEILNKLGLLYNGATATLYSRPSHPKKTQSRHTEPCTTAGFRGTRNATLYSQPSQPKELQSRHIAASITVNIAGFRGTRNATLYGQPSHPKKLQSCRITVYQKTQTAQHHTIFSHQHRHLTHAMLCLRCSSKWLSSATTPSSITVEYECLVILMLSSRVAKAMNRHTTVTATQKHYHP